MANRSYWQKRMKALENQSYQSALQCYQDIQEEYRKAINNLQMDIMKWYQRLADNNDISYAAAKKFLKSSSGWWSSTLRPERRMRLTSAG